MLKVISAFRPLSLTRLTYGPYRSFCSDDDFKKQSKLQVTDENAQQIIDRWVKENNLVLFMKGSPHSPRCGYSAQVVKILKLYGLLQYKHVNILADPVLREQVKLYSGWPTYPQLFVKGELVGGCDIVTEMHKDGTLKELLEQESLI